ncbi:hypothetical protein H6P81_009178 [Aristolochia fimbriata]|uniref:Uncharacterized protein n=1 Tax=Aristolochia fimbriata TaxID=158543 RepID=A0AAV7EK54_ARIFI|nr:hypothetical protein H6P81_009178 [Aristolochia fimbriata]
MPILACTTPPARLAEPKRDVESIWTLEEEEWKMWTTGTAAPDRPSMHGRRAASAMRLWSNGTPQEHIHVNTRHCLGGRVEFKRLTSIRRPTNLTSRAGTRESREPWCLAKCQQLSRHERRRFELLNPALSGGVRGLGAQLTRVSRISSHAAALRLSDQAAVPSFVADYSMF